MRPWHPVISVQTYFHCKNDFIINKMTCEKWLKVWCKMHETAKRNDSD